MAGQRSGRSRFGFKVVLLAVLCCALHLNDLNGCRTLALPGSSRETKAELEKMKVAQLREKLREKGEKVSGRKAELIERLLKGSDAHNKAELQKVKVTQPTEKLREKRRVLPPLSSRANPEKHVFIPLKDYGRKIEKLFGGQEFLFIRGGVAVGKSTLMFVLGQQYPKKYVDVPFSSGREEDWVLDIIEAIEEATQTKLEEESPWLQLEDALQLAKDRDLILVLDEAHTIFRSQRLVTLLFKSDGHCKLLLISAGEPSGFTTSWTSPFEIRQKIFWTPPVPEDFDDLTKQLKEADVRLDQRSVEFFMKLCGGHRSIFISAMYWVREEQLGESWDFRTVLSKVQDSMATRTWSLGTFLGALADSRGARVCGYYSDVDMLPDEFIQLLCEGPGQLPAYLRGQLTIYGFVIPLPQNPEVPQGEFREVDWTCPRPRYAVSNPILASFYRDELEDVRGLKVGVDPSAFDPANCLDLLLRAIPYLTFERVVGCPDATNSKSMSKDNLPLEDLYNAAIINTLKRLSYKAGSSESPSLRKVEVFISPEQQLSMEGIMASRTQGEHDENRNRFDDKPNQTAYSKADHKGFFTIGNKERVRDRVRDTRAEGVEIIGLVPNIAHTGYHILYRGLEAKLLPQKLTRWCSEVFTPGFVSGSILFILVRFELLSLFLCQLSTLKGAQAAPADLVEYYVECDLVARGLIDGQIRCIQKLLHINPPPNRPGAPW